jgi:hypothetical protein
MPIAIDMSGVGDGGFPVLAEGVYPGHVDKIELSPKPGPSGFHYLKFTYQSDEGSKRNLFANYSLSPQALWKLKQDLTALGVEVPEGEFEFEPADVLGLKCQLRVSIKPHYKNPDQDDNELEEVLPAGEEMSWA